MIKWRRATSAIQGLAAERVVRAKFMKAARSEHPMWFDLGVAGQQWDNQRADWTRTLETKVPGADPLAAMSHLLDRWPGGVLGYNAWWASGQARQMGLLDDQCRPVRSDGPPVNDEARRMVELAELGGPGAVAAYQQVFPA